MKPPIADAGRAWGRGLLGRPSVPACAQWSLGPDSRPALTHTATAGTWLGQALDWMSGLPLLRGPRGASGLLPGPQSPHL